MRPQNLQFFYELLSHALWYADKPVDPEDFPTPPSDSEWKEVLGYASAHSVAGIFGQALSLLPQEWRPKEELLSTMTKAISDDDCSYRRHADTLLRLNEALRPYSLRPIFFRNAVWASYYRYPEHLRIQGLTAVIAPARRQTIIHGMEEIGATAEENYMPWEKRYLYQGVRCQLFFQTCVLHCPKSRRYYRELETRAMYALQPCRFNLGDQWLPTFSPVFSIVCQTAYLQRQLILGRITLRQICDWSMLLHKERTALGIAENHLLRHLGNLGLQRLYDALGNFARRRLGLPNTSYAALHTTPKAVALGNSLHTFIEETPQPGDITDPACPAQEKWTSKVIRLILIFTRCWHLRRLCPRESFFAPWAELKAAFFPPRMP